MWRFFSFFMLSLCLIPRTARAEIRYGETDVFMHLYQAIPKIKGQNPLPTSNPVYLVAFEPIDIARMTAHVRNLSDRLDLIRMYQRTSFDARDLMSLVVYRLRQRFHKDGISEVRRQELDERLRLLFKGEGRLYAAFSRRTPTESDPSPIEVHISIAAWPETAHGIPYERTHVPRGAPTLPKLEWDFSQLKLAVLSSNGDGFYRNDTLSRLAHSAMRVHRRRLEIGLLTVPDPMEYKFYGLLHGLIEMGHGTHQSAVPMVVFPEGIYEDRLVETPEGFRVFSFPGARERHRIWYEEQKFQPTPDPTLVVPELGNLEGVREVVAWTANASLGKMLFQEVGFEKKFEYQLSPSQTESPANAFPRMEFYSMPISRWHNQVPIEFERFGDHGFKKLTLMAPLFIRRHLLDMLDECRPLLHRIGSELGVPSFLIVP